MLASQSVHAPCRQVVKGSSTTKPPPPYSSSPPTYWCSPPSQALRWSLRRSDSIGASWRGSPLSDVCLCREVSDGICGDSFPHETPMTPMSCTTLRKDFSVHKCAWVMKYARLAYGPLYVGSSTLCKPYGSSRTSSEGIWTLLAPTPVPPSQKVLGASKPTPNTFSEGTTGARTVKSSLLIRPVALTLVREQPP